MDEFPAGRLHAAAAAVQSAIEEHERRCHIPPARHGPLQAIPFANIRCNDVQVARALEIIGAENGTIEDAAAAIGVPVLVLERELAEFRPRWRRFLYEREAAV